MKIVINKCYGGFGLSVKGLLWLYDKGYKDNLCEAREYYGLDRPDGEKRLKADLKKWEKYRIGKMTQNDFYPIFTPDQKYVIMDRLDFDRSSPLLIECIETLGIEVNGWAAKLVIIDIPDNIEYEIDDYDGIESIHEKHRSW